jgi:ferrochelatase
MSAAEGVGATIGGVPTLDPYDAVLLLSFGGPEGPADVMPFLENVTRGRGIPRERLLAVAEHYDAVGGRSPINDQNRALLDALRVELAARGHHPLLGWGNRNWAPFLTDTLSDLCDAGARRVVVVTTSAYSSYSSCRQYREDLGAAVLDLASRGRQVEVAKVRAYYDHPGFAVPQLDRIVTALESLPEAARSGARLLFVTHSVPVAMAETSGPDGGAYPAQHRELASHLAAGVAERTGAVHPWELVFCSRSGPPAQPWLEPDINDRLRELAAGPVDGTAIGESGVVVVPLGFVSDHMEVVHDLDTEAAETARTLGIPFVRAATVGVDERFVAGLVDLVEERAAQARGEQPQRPSVDRLGPWHVTCPVGCCPNPRGERPAACGADWLAPVAVGSRQ